MNLSFENKVALVTGAASGMGLATAEAFAAAGAAVALVDINEAAVRKVADRLAGDGHKTIAVRCARRALCASRPPRSGPEAVGRSARHRRLHFACMQAADAM